VIRILNRLINFEADLAQINSSRARISDDTKIYLNVVAVAKI
jgi:hypothetical protein